MSYFEVSPKAVVEDRKKLMDEEPGKHIARMIFLGGNKVATCSFILPYTSIIPAQRKVSNVFVFHPFTEEFQISLCRSVLLAQHEILGQTFI